MRLERSKGCRLKKPAAEWLLEDRYDRKDLIISEHMLALQRLKKVTKASDVTALQALYTEVQVHTCSLANLEED